MGSFPSLKERHYTSYELSHQSVELIFINESQQFWTVMPEFHAGYTIKPNLDDSEKTELINFNL